MATQTKSETVVITAPNFGYRTLLIEGIAPLVIERFSKKAELMEKMAQGKQAKSKREHAARDYERDTEDARYRSSDGWEGMNAAAFRCGAISACRLVNFKMTLGKLSIFIEPDGFDKLEGMPLVRIHGKSETFTAHTRNATGVADVRARPIYREWAAMLKIRYDEDQFSVADMINLFSRVGAQVGVGAGRPDSKASAGQGWGMFRLVPSSEQQSVSARFGIVA